MKKLMLSVLLLSATNAYCVESGNRVYFGGTKGQVSIDVDDELVNEDFRNTSDRILGVGGFIGYKLSKNIYFTLGVEKHFSVDSFLGVDSVDLSNTHLKVAYLFQNESIYFAPFIGSARYTLDAREGPLFNPGPEESQRIKGTAGIFGFEAGFKFATRFDIFVNYTDINVSFGEYRPAALGLRYHLNR